MVEEGGCKWMRMRILSSGEEFWKENINGGYATIFTLLFIFLYQVTCSFYSFFRRLSSSTTTTTALPHSSTPNLRTEDIITDDDLKSLIAHLDGKVGEDRTWEDVIERRNNFVYYKARCCKPKYLLDVVINWAELSLYIVENSSSLNDGPLKYLSVTIFENCSTKVLRDFYMDNDYRMKWDKTIVEHQQLQVDQTNGLEVGRTIKKFPFLTPREYVLAWRLWEGNGKSFYCYTKDCEHPLAPKRKKYVRVGFFRSGWRIREVPGRNACEIKMIYQEDAGLNTEMAKLAFSKGIWSYVCKMDNALRRYSVSHSRSNSSPTAVTLVQKVPSSFEAVDSHTTSITRCTSLPSASTRSITANTDNDTDGSELLRKPSKKWIAKSLFLLGGLVCLSCGQTNMGARIAMALILTKLSKRRASSGSRSQNTSHSNDQTLR
ncbi:START domain [Dillenia turbinata]|uniref:START domain n=1 Tax=Dillenia turbinata TaxID=194707 RepID=A0AAN8UE49_9MAGN